MPTPNLPSLLQTLTKDRLVALGRDYQVGLSSRATKDLQIETLERSGQLRFTDLLTHLNRDELKAALRSHQLDDSGRSRRVLTDRLIEALGHDVAEPAVSPWSTGEIRHTPRPGDVVHARQRQYLVEAVTPSTPSPTSNNGGRRHHTRVDLVCLDDDNQGRPLSLLWELELGARVLQPEKQGLGEVTALDSPRVFSGYLHALRWNAVTATDSRLFQSPFRAGIRVINHQLTPLMKALQLPRANLFIADDVGIGKTIEAGLVLQELILRQRVDLVLITCPAAICLQWRDEMEKRFGLRFEIMNRAFVARRRQERGFGVNPWATHNRFILSHSLLRRPEYRDPLLQRLELLQRGGTRARKSLLILDEAHVAAPASATKYAVDSQVTRTIRDLAPRFENRLFLSATPHNGHSNSFSSLLEILDPQRFTRGVPIRSRDELEAVMVRRLKSDLRELDNEKFPERKIIAIDLAYRDGVDGTDKPSGSAADTGWWQTFGGAEPAPLLARPNPEPIEIELAEKLAEYTRLMKPRRGRSKRLVFINLQKRLLSSVEAFYRTLKRHARGVGAELLAAEEAAAEAATKEASRQLELAASADQDPDPAPTATSTAPPRDQESGPSASGDPNDTKSETGRGRADESTAESGAESSSEYGTDDEEQDAADDAVIESSSRELQSPEGRARELLQEMLQIAERYRAQPDAKSLSLLDWIRKHQCPGVFAAGTRPGESRADVAFPEDAALSPKERRWSDRRVIVFTEYGDTKRALFQLLSGALAGTDRADERILLFHGGMSDEQREEVQTAFNARPSDHPVRILIATDAAREGVNLQGHCADLFHFDIPWNPARLEQRNGRIDRTLQAEPEVRCHYFRYPQRPEDVVLDKVVAKVEVIRQELGSLSTVILDRMERALRDGIEDKTAAALDRAEETTEGERQAQKELETQRERKRLSQEIEAAGTILDASQKVIQFNPEALRHVVDIGLSLAHCGPLEPRAAVEMGGRAGDHGTNDEKNRESLHSRSSRHAVAAFDLPEMPATWQSTLDSLRPPRARDEAPWEWRRRPPLPVVFESLQRLDSRYQQLHLEHPFVQRLLSRFLAQGTSAFDLSRVTVLPDPDKATPRVIALGRVSLFGPGATRLHDELVTVAAPWRESGTPPHLEAYADREERTTVDTLWELLAKAPALDDLSRSVQQRLAESAAVDFAALWPAVEEEADHLAHDAGQKLRRRGATESEQLRQILDQQRRAIEAEIGARQQLVVEFTETERDQREQFEQDRRHMERRLAAIDHEIEREPAEIEELYRVTLRRLEPVGLVYLWPESWG